MSLQKVVMDNPAVPRKHKLLLLGLAHFSDESGRSDPTLHRLAQITDYEASHIRKQLHKLAELGLIVIERKRNNEGRLANHYEITLPEAEAA